MKLLAAEQRGINMVTNYSLVASDGKFTQNTHPPSPSLRVGKGTGDGYIKVFNHKGLKGLHEGTQRKSL
jgi:hypothetical protein